MANVATRIEDLYKHTRPEPLRPEEFHDWYRDLSSVRGELFLQRLRIALERAHESAPYRAFVMGHSGSGKSTELTRLCRMLDRQFLPLRLMASAELDPGAFEPFDVILVTLEEVIRRTALPENEGGAATRVGDNLLRRVRQWLGSVEELRTTSGSVAASVEAGVGPKGDGLLASVLGMFATARGEAKYASSRKVEVREHQLRRLSGLIELANDVFTASNAALLKTTGKEWLVIWEDFDKPGFSDANVQDLFLKYGHLWKSLRCSLLVTIPMSLGYSEGAARLPLPPECIFVVPDPPVFDRDHRPDHAGRQALVDLLTARVSAKLFDAGQAEALVVASGGNLRDLLSLVNRAADTALLREVGSGTRVISAGDVDEAKAWLRNQYLLRLGESPYEAKPIASAEKIERLKRIHSGEPEASMPDRTLYALLRTHAVQEFNHKRWLGVHPLVVDILVDQRQIEGVSAAGGTRG